MSGDLEDFLRRAAQRRQAKAGQAKAGQGNAGQAKPAGASRQRATQQPPPAKSTRQRPEYSNSRSERLVRPVEEEIVVAEIVEDVDSEWQQRRRRIEEAKRAAKQAQAEVGRQVSKLKKKSTDQTPVPVSPLGTGHAIDDLLNLIHRPGGMQQAILLREILDRPEHRW
ncbi:hypothetical protein CA13_69050 [Planctomycetes bacterium CA13]|uniref:Uncharacterized protein n=1 Tax=Novipirellula herctigrandis TaxID=2527986 RepID=A0A5C5YNA1_9BACT|nr:hypothetical protein CA13_69050 [Planctomycetes bacterium CA13]